MSMFEVLAIISLVAALYLLIPVLFIERWRKGRTLLSETNVIHNGGNYKAEDVQEEIEVDTPNVSVLFTARNEARSIGNTIALLKKQDYPAFEIIAINDRSDDGTGHILEQERMGSEQKIKSLSIETLPDEWLGKCHALWKGAALAKGEWLLFTDADVSFDSDVIRLAVQAADRYGADHLTLFPQLLWRTYLEATLLTIFTMMLGVGFRFWLVESRSLKAFVGIGAFNMIRRDVYDRFNGHEALRMEIADDMKLGYLAKQYGGRSVAVYSEGKVRVRWRDGAADIVRGIIRSGFAGMDFNWWRALYAIVGIITVFLLPFFLTILSQSPAAQSIALAAIVVVLIALSLTAQSQRIPIITVLLYPIAAILFLIGIVLSAVLTTIKGGVYWRETFYPISKLRKGSVR